MALLRTLLKCPGATLPSVRATAAALKGSRGSRALSYVPVDDLVNGLTEEQIQVSSEGVAWVWFLLSETTLIEL